MLLGEIDVHVSPSGGVSVSNTVPVKPFFAPIVMVELADWPAFTGDGEVDVMVKSGGGGPRLRKLRRHPHPIGMLPHCKAP